MINFFKKHSSQIKNKEKWGNNSNDGKGGRKKVFTGDSNKNKTAARNKIDNKREGRRKERERETNPL